MRLYNFEDNAFYISDRDGKTVLTVSPEMFVDIKANIMEMALWRVHFMDGRIVNFFDVFNEALCDLDIQFERKGASYSYDGENYTKMFDASPKYIQ